MEFYYYQFMLVICLLGMAVFCITLGVLMLWVHKQEQRFKERYDQWKKDN